MPNDLRLPWTVKGAPDPLSDYVNLIDSEGRDICTVYAMHTNGKTNQIKHILERCNPKPQEVIKEPVDISASPSEGSVTWPASK